MTGKDFLHKVWVAQMCYKEVKTEYHCVCEDVESLRAIDYSTPVSNGRRKDFADIVVKLEEKKNSLYEEAKFWTDISNQCAVIIQSMACGANTEIYQKILRWRYLCHMTWEQIAVDLHFSYRRVLQLHGSALVEFEKAFARQLDEKERRERM